MHMMSCPHCGKEMEMAEMEKHKTMMHPDKETHSNSAMSSNANMSDDTDAQKAGMDETERQ